MASSARISRSLAFHSVGSSESANAASWPASSCSSSLSLACDRLATASPGRLSARSAFAQALCASARSAAVAASVGICSARWARGRRGPSRTGRRPSGRNMSSACSIATLRDLFTANFFVHGQRAPRLPSIVRRASQRLGGEEPPARTPPMSDFGSGGSSLATDFTPTDCAPRTGPAGGNCTSIYVSTVEEICLLSAGATCAAGHEAYETAGGPQAGFAWGIFLSLFGDVIISIGLALQK
eukprot:scaffold80768_cov63-Phaeocystis_antarctica.AAC.2